jgi:hypothetical protein
MWKSTSRVGRKQPSVLMWQGIGILSRQGKIIEAYADGSYAEAKFSLYHPKGSRLVLVTARLENVTKKQAQQAGVLGLVRSAFPVKVRGR